MNIQTLAEDLASKNPDRYSRWFAEDIRLFTPVHEEPFIGRQAACQILALVFSLFDEFQFPDTIAGQKSHPLFFRTQVGGVLLEGMDSISPIESTGGALGRILPFFPRNCRIIRPTSR
jgi:hypothetical protein